MTLFSISKEAAKEIRENLYRDHYSKPIRFEKAEETVGDKTVKGYTFNEDRTH